MAKVTLTIHNGHRNAQNGQTGTSGKTSDGRKYTEVQLMDDIYAAMKPRLILAGVDVYYDDADIKSGKVTDYFIALHADGNANNADIRGGFVDDSPTDMVATESWKFAQAVADAYFPKIGIPFVPSHSTNNSRYYYAFSLTGANTKQFIIELGTMTNLEDMDKLADVPYVASLLVDGILNYLRQNEPNYKPDPQPPANTTDKDKQIEDLKKRIVDIQKENSEKLAKAEIDCQSRLQAFKDLVRKDLQKLLDGYK